MPPSQIQVPPLGLATVRGALLSDVKAPRAGPGTRGKELTAAQETVLWSLYLQHKLFPFDNKLPAKRFWCDLAKKFQEQTQRSYSWLSAKRRIVALLRTRGIQVEWCAEPPRVSVLGPGSREAAVQCGRGSADDDGGELSSAPGPGFESARKKNGSQDTLDLSQKPTINPRLENIQSSNRKSETVSAPDNRTGSIREENGDVDDSHFSRRSTFNQRLKQLQGSQVKQSVASMPEQKTVAVSNWLKKNHSTSLPDKDADSDDAEPLSSKSPCPKQTRPTKVTKSRARSRSPLFDKHPVYRSRSPRSYEKTEQAPKRKDHSSSAQASRSELRKRRPFANDFLECTHLVSQTGSPETPRNANSEQPDTLDSTSSDDENDLPETPVRIPRRLRDAQ
ncbi:uncharacterized protein N7511_008214 [Penicillium nucicola]|uniref:uncharacterized protein n=1 Tax=Penicillium nucicola TaxID=1850975 RepID=UPI002544FA5B|nr:uncharacterized protein N7511_008214 [Penicillium nucicola]KAJ5754061.1 hypothetical protein N7511_008214 [Penicillium nucicola]